MSTYKRKVHGKKVKWEDDKTPLFSEKAAHKERATVNIDRLSRIVPLARNPEPDSRCILIAEIVIGVILMILLYTVVYYQSYLHDQITYMYALAGVQSAQEKLINLYLGNRLEREFWDHALYYMKKFAQQGHPEYAYNLAVSRYKGHHREVGYEEMMSLLTVAMNANITDAKKLYNVCKANGCQHIN